jgi:hypothetical protein
MLLVKNSHPKIGGLQPVVVAIAEGYTKPQGQFIQIVNVKGQHWITLSNIGCRAGTVRVYDSWKRSLHTDTKAAILGFILITNVLFTRITNCQNETFLW